MKNKSYNKRFILLERVGEDSFWHAIDIIGWGTKTVNHKKISKELDEKYDSDFLNKFLIFSRTKRRELQDFLIESDKNREGYYCGGDDGFWDLTAHIVGLGKLKYNSVLKNPNIARKIGKDNYYHENFEYCFF